MARILVTVHGPDAGVRVAPRRILEGAGHEVRYTATEYPRLPTEALVAQLPRAAGVLAGGETYGAPLFEQCPDLRVISRAGVGYDNIDLGAAADRGIPVLVSAGASHMTVAETTIGLMLSLVRRLDVGFVGVPAGRWPQPPTTELYGKTVGIVGLGRIGRAVAQRLAGFEVTLIASETAPDMSYMAAHGIALVDLDDLFSRSDVVTLHVPLTPDTARMVNAKRLAQMKSTAYLVNTARGGVVDEDDLYAALSTNAIAGAGLDAWTEEPPSDTRLAKLPNVLSTAHMGGNSYEAFERMGSVAAQNLVDVLGGSWDRAMVVNGVYSE